MENKYLMKLHHRNRDHKGKYFLFINKKKSRIPTSNNSSERHKIEFL